MKLTTMKTSTFKGCNSDKHNSKLDGHVDWFRIRLNNLYPFSRPLKIEIGMDKVESRSCEQIFFLTNQ